MLYKFFSTYKLYLVPLFLVTVNLFQPFNYLFIIFSLWLFLKRPKFIFDITLLFLVFFMVSYNLVSTTGGVIGRLLEIFFPISFYIVGKYMTRVINNQKGIILLVLFFVFFLNFIPIISLLKNILIVGFDFSGLVLLGSSSVNTPFTLFCSFFAFNMALLPITFLNPKNSFEKKIKLITRLFVFSGVLVIGLIGQRTGFVIVLASSLIFLFISGKDFKKYITYYLLSVMIVIILLSFIDSSWLYESKIYQRFFIEDSNNGVLSSRSVIWEDSYKLLINNPNGIKLDNKNNGFSYAHNIWLDVGLKGGYFPIFFLLVLSFMFIWKNFKILKFQNNFTPNLYLLLISVSIISTFMVEPIMEGYSIFFASFTFIFGVLSGFVELNMIKNE